MKKDSLEARYEQIIESAQRVLGENLKLTDDQYLAAALKNPKRYFLHLYIDPTSEIGNPDLQYSSISIKNERGKYDNFSGDFYGDDYDDLLAAFEKHAPDNIDYHDN